MSGVVKGVGKVFKAVGKVVKKIAKPVAIAAAVYFTGGLALSAFGPTQAFAAALPGFGISSTGAATGIFSKAASTLGLSGGLRAGAGATAGGGFFSPAGGAAALNKGATVTGGVAKVAATEAATKAGLGLTETLLLASMGSKAVGAFLAPSLGTQYEEAKRWRGGYYGTYHDGSTDADPEATASTPSGGPATPPTRMLSTPESVAAAPQPVASQPARQLLPSQPRQTAQATTEAPAARSVDGGQSTDNAPIEPKRLMQPGVRYV